MNENTFWFATSLGIALFVILTIWSFIWKGIALWHAARKQDKVWYIVLLILNTLGILEILYIYIFSKGKEEV